MPAASQQDWKRVGQLTRRLALYVWNDLRQHEGDWAGSIRGAIVLLSEVLQNRF